MSENKSYVRNMGTELFAFAMCLYYIITYECI